MQMIKGWRERDLASVGLLPKCPHKPDRGQVEAKNSELATWAIINCLPGCINRKLDQKPDSQGLIGTQIEKTAFQAEVQSVLWVEAESPSLFFGGVRGWCECSDDAVLLLNSPERVTCFTVSGSHVFYY